MYLIKDFLTRIYGERFSGEMKSNSKGDGYDLEDIREYTAGDNVKNINWKISAKYDQEFINLYKIEKEPVIDIFVDYNINFSIIEDKMKDYFSYLDLLFSKLSIKKNIFYFNKSWGELKQTKLEKFTLIKNTKKKSCINEILKSDLYKMSKSYKIIISDLFFIEEDYCFDNKYFFIVPNFFPLLKNKSFPVLNGYFSYNFNSNLLKNWNDFISKLEVNSYVEKIF